jgi:PhoPQ-activated pathogenicity-related protein
MKRVAPRRSLAALRRRRVGGAGHDSGRWYHPQLETLENRCLLSIAPSTIVGRFTFYDHSRYDGNIAGISANDNSAIASDKSALLSGTGAATFGNVTSYSNGINGIMVDITGSHPSITASDFTFRVGNNNSPASWSSAPNPASVSVRAGAGTSGADRVEIVWTDGNITKKWLQVIVAADKNTGLAQSDVFFFGNAVGDSGLGDTAINATVNATDENGARLNPANLAANIPLTNIYDFDRNGQVNANDQNISRLNATNSTTVVKYVSPPAVSSPVLSADLANDTGPDDGITSDPTVAGSLTAANSLVSFLAGLNGGPVSTNVLPLVQPGGAFTLNEAFLTSLAGGSLPDGVYTLHLQARDSQGLSAAVHVDFTLDRVISPPALPDLIAADDAGTSNTDNITNINTPRIDVTADSGSLIRLYVDNVEVAQGTASPTVQFTLPLLSDGLHDIKAVAEDGANSAQSPILTIDVRTVVPTISVATVVPFTDDITPHVTIVSSIAELVRLDVDINDDGDFSDAGELSRTTSSTFNGSAYFQLTPALPLNMAGSDYVVQLRARVSDIAGNEGISTLQSLRIDTLGSSALETYVQADDYTATEYLPGSPVTFTGGKMYILDLKSQTWRSLDDVNKPEWHHWLRVYVPDGAISTTALLSIGGGSTSATPSLSPNTTLTGLATQLASVIVELPTVPNQPLLFTDDPLQDSRTEDEIIAFTFDQFRQHLGDPGNETWPALLAMTKSAVSAMNATQDLIARPDVNGAQINDFIVTGFSKRGWTTWLTAASDDRVKAIIPGVIDVLNMDEQMIHHYGFYYGVSTHLYQGFSDQIYDYASYGIIQNSLDAAGEELGRIIDPYRYLHNGRFDDMPKLILNASGDEFFVPDSSQYYFSDLPGTQNYLRYFPNSGHGLPSAGVVSSTASFFDAVLGNDPLPQYSWTVQQNGAIRLQTTTVPTSVVMWQATNPVERDFRHAYNPSIVWTSSTITPAGNVYIADPSVPTTGATAFFIEMTYPSGIPGNPFIFTTEIKVKSNIALADWPYFMPPNSPGPLTALVAEDDSGLDAVAVGLTALAADRLATAEAAPATVPATPTTAIAVTDDEEETSYIATSDWPWTDETSDDSVLEDEEVVDLALSSLSADDFS